MTTYAWYYVRAQAGWREFCCSCKKGILHLGNSIYPSSRCMVLCSFYLWDFLKKVSHHVRVFLLTKLSLHLLFFNRYYRYYLPMYVSACSHLFSLCHCSLHGDHTAMLETPVGWPWLLFYYSYLGLLHVTPHATSHGKHSLPNILKKY